MTVKLPIAGYYRKMRTRSPLALIGLLGLSLIGARAGTTRAHDLTAEYRQNGDGLYVAYMRNARGAAVTAYIVQASMRLGGRERHTAFGGDTLGFANGHGTELPPHSETAPGSSLPHGAEPVATNVAAVIYADGSTEGDDEIVGMLLSGRHRAWADLKQAVPALEKAAAGRTSKEELQMMFAEMQSRDQADAMQLDEMLEISNMRYAYFMSAVPSVGIAELQTGDAAGLLKRFRDWQQRLSASKPDIK